MVMLYNTNNTRINNINSSLAELGFLAFRSYNLTFYNVSGQENSIKGISANYADNIYVGDSAFQSSETGITLWNSDNLTIYNVTTKAHTSSGITLSSANNASISRATSDGNNYGIWLYASSGNKIVNSTITNNAIGIWLTRSSDYNIINTSRIQGSSTYGIEFVEISSNDPEYNTIYDNIINNSNNINIDSGIANENYFNTTKTAGTNIIGGNWIGGNFYTNSTGDDVSDTCTDIAEPFGICDSPYEVNDTYSWAWDNLTLTDGGPVITLLQPANYTNYNISNITFNFTVADAGGVKNCSIYTNTTGTWALNQSNTSLVGAANNFTINDIPDGNFSWNVQCYDNNENKAWHYLNWSFGMSTTSCTTCASCEAKLASAAAGETVTLSADISTTGNCIDLEVINDDVTFDCGSNTITGHQDGYGINITAQENVTVANCKITNFTRAIHLDGTNYSNFTDLTLYENNGDYAGFYMYKSNYNNITTLNASLNNASDNAGLFLEQSSNMRVVNTTYTGNNVTSAADINGGGIVGLYDNSNSSYFENIVTSSNIVNMTGTAQYIKGSGIVGLYSSCGYNTFNIATIAGDTVQSSYHIQGGGDLGLYDYSSNNIFTTVTVSNSSIISKSVWGGGSVGLYSFCSNNSFTDTSITNTSINSSIDGGGALGIIWSSNNNDFTTVTITNTSTTSLGIYGGGVLGITLNSNNNFNTVTITNTSTTVVTNIIGGGALGLYWASYNNFTTLTMNNNTVSSGNEYGLIGIGRQSENNRIVDGQINDSSENLFYLYEFFATGTANSIFENLTLANAGKHAIKLNHWDTINNSFRNISIVNTTLAAINITGAKDIDLLNITFTTTPWDVYAYNATITEYNMTDFSLEYTGEYGGISFINTSLNANGSNLSKVIQVAFNSMHVNSTLDPMLNQSANISIYSITYSDVRSVWDTQDDGTFVDCPAAVCTNISYENDVFKFNVTHFTTYKVNSPPNVTLYSPFDNNQSTNRTQMFIWNSSDAESDPLTYDINITCMYAGGQCSDSRYVAGYGTGKNYTPTTELKYLWDGDLTVEHYWYIWKVRANDGISYSDWSEIWNFSVNSYVNIDLDPRGVNFTNSSTGITNTTVDNDPAPIVIYNHGNCLVNLTLNTTAWLWSEYQTSSEYWSFKVDETSELRSYYAADTLEGWTQFDMSNQTIVAWFNYSDTNDSLEIDINITVPQTEPVGNKTGNFTVYARYAPNE